MTPPCWTDCRATGDPAACCVIVRPGAPVGGPIRAGRTARGPADLRRFPARAADHSDLAVRARRPHRSGKPELPPAAPAGPAASASRLCPCARTQAACHPDALDSACRGAPPGNRVRAVYLMPSCRNPTLTRMSLRRREEIVEVCRRHDLLIMEDDVFALAHSRG